MENFCNWLLDKVVNHLVLREGCKAGLSTEKADINTAYVTDSLGFMYAVNVRLIGRLKNQPEDESHTARFISDKNVLNQYDKANFR